MSFVVPGITHCEEHMNKIGLGYVCEECEKKKTKKRLNAIFLDIDGVLNNETHTVLLHEMLGENQYLDILREMQEIPFDYQSCILVQKLIQETNAVVILSSTWRIHPKGVSAIHKYAGITINDITPRLLSAIRGEEIKQFLDNNKEITNYVIIDDDSDMLEEQKEHFVKINSRFGFRQKDYDRCLKILKEDNNEI